MGTKDACGPYSMDRLDGEGRRKVKAKADAVRQSLLRPLTMRLLEAQANIDCNLSYRLRSMGPGGRAEARILADIAKHLHGAHVALDKLTDVVACRLLNAEAAGLAAKDVYAPETAEEQTSALAFLVAQWEAGVRADVTRTQYFQISWTPGVYSKALTRDDPGYPDWYRYSYQDRKWIDYPEGVADQWAPMYDGGYFREVSEEECLKVIAEHQALHDEQLKAVDKAPDKPDMRKPG